MYISQHMGDTFFSWVVEYHCTRHLPEGFPLTEHTRVDGREPQVHPGLLILKNGPRTIDDLIADALVNPDMIGGEDKITDKNSLFDYLDENARMDGVHIMSEDGTIMWVYVLNNKYSQQRALHLLPPDFFGGSKQLSEGNVGNKTRLAVHLPRALPHFKAYLVNQTQVNGVGPASYFTHQGLAERVYFQPSEEDSRKRRGVHQQYELKDGRYTFERKERLFLPEEYSGSQQRAA